MFKKNIKKNRAFTLVEMLVSMTLFSFVITIALGSLFSIMKTNEKAKVIKTVVDNLNIALEGMGRELRVGSQYRGRATDTYGSSDHFQSNAIYFKTKYNCDAYYKFDASSGSIKKYIEKPDNTGHCRSASEVDLTSSNVDITKLEFIATGLGGSDNIQPRVLILVTGEIKNVQLKEPEIFNIQTTISQRKIDQ